MTPGRRVSVLLLVLAAVLAGVGGDLRAPLAALVLALLALAVRRGGLRRGRRRRRRRPRFPWSRAAARGRPPIPLRIRQHVFARDGYACLYCGRRRSPAVALQLDHLYPYSLGGTDDPENLVAACAECNLAKGATVFRSDRDLERFARRRQAWAAESRRRQRFPPRGWLLLLLALVLAAALAWGR